MIRAEGLIIIIAVALLIAALSGSRLARRMLGVTIGIAAGLVVALWLFFGKV